MTDRLSNTLKYPYYDTAIVVLIRQQLKLELLDLAQIAAAQNSEIVIMPVPLQDVYVQSTVLIAHMHIIMMIVKCTSPQR